MKTILKKIYRTLLSYGFDVRIFLQSIKERKNWFHADLKEFKKQKGSDNTHGLFTLYPILTDRNDESGRMRGHYFHQDLYVARLINSANPRKHLDIGSRIDGFVAHVASFRVIEVVDIRINKNDVKNIEFRQADLMKLPSDLIDYCDSISSLHAIEHFGLGRYGDPIDYFGYLKAIDNIASILQPGGTFYFSVPIGSQRIEFNAQRVFSLEYLMNILSEKFSIISFSYVDDKGDFFEDVALEINNVKSNYGCHYGCGIFILIKNR